MATFFFKASPQLEPFNSFPAVLGHEILAEVAAVGPETPGSGSRAARGGEPAAAVPPARHPRLRASRARRGGERVRADGGGLPGGRADARLPEGSPGGHGHGDGGAPFAAPRGARGGVEQGGGAGGAAGGEPARGAQGGAPGHGPGAGDWRWAGGLRGAVGHPGAGAPEPCDADGDGGVPARSSPGSWGRTRPSGCGRTRRRRTRWRG